MSAVDFYTPHVCTLRDETRLKFHSTESLPGIRARPATQLTYLDRLKLCVGAAKIAHLLNEDNEHEPFLVSLKSFSKHTGLPHFLADRLLASPRALDNISKIASLVIESSSLEKASDIFQRVLKNLSPILLDRDFSLPREHVYLATSADKTWFLQLGVLIGRGLDSDAWSVTDITAPSETSLVFKQSKSKSSSLELLEGFSLLKTLNPEGKITGLQLPYYRVVELRHKADKTPKVGYLMPRYLGNMRDFLFEEKTQFIKAFYQLICGLKALHEKNYCHYDIKPANMLYSASRFDIADLADCRSLHQITQILHRHQTHPFSSIFDTSSRLWSIATDLYCYGEDSTKLSKIIADLDEKNLSLREASSQVLTLLQARDLYAFGHSLLELISGIEGSVETRLLQVSVKLSNLGIDPCIGTKLSGCLSNLIDPEPKNRFNGFKELQLIFPCESRISC